MHKIQQAVPEDEYIIKVILNNGHIILLNLNSRINTARFNILKDKELFKRLTVKDDFIIWKSKDGDKVELSYTDVMYLLQTSEDGTNSLIQKQIYHNFVR
jgi:hypothetical protein